MEFISWVRIRALGLWGNYYSRNQESTDQFLRLVTYFRPFFKLILVALCFDIIQSGTTGLTAYMLEPVMNRVFTDKDIGFLKIIPAILIALFVTKGIARFTANYLVRYSGEKVIRKIRNDLYRHYQYLDAAYFTDNNVGIMMSRITNDVNMMQRAVSSLEVLFREPFAIVFLAGVCFYQYWQAAFVLFFIFPLTAIPIVYFGKRLRKWVRRSQERIGLLNSILKETFSGVRVIKAFGMEEYEIKRFGKENDKVFQANVKSMVMEEASSPAVELLGALAAAAVIIIGGYKVIEGQITTGAFFSFMAALGLLYEPLKKINKMYLSFQAALAAVARVFEVLDTKPTIVDHENAVTIKGVEKEIHFSHVSFRYGPEQPDVLSDLEFTVKTGQVAAIVGSSGAGKTTLVNLLPRFWDVTEGAILFDGIDIRDITMKSLREQIGIVTQETFLFADSVAANIAYDDVESDTEKIIETAKAANAHDFIMKLPNQYDTMIGELGVKLSGGQRQRLAIARALYKDAPVLILDEATSALDTESEREVQAALERLLTGRTSFVIAHRLSTILRADRIFVVQDGAIVEDGRHDELMALDGEYARIYRMQFETDTENES